MVVLDTSVLAIALDAEAAVPQDPTTGQPITNCRERINALIADLSDRRTRILVPAPVVAEYVSGGGLDREQRVTALMEKQRVFAFAPFDFRAAMECGLIHDSDAMKKLTADERKAKVRFDRQIIATALATGATHIFTGDKKLGAKAKECGLQVVYTWELPLPGGQLALEYTPVSINSDGSIEKN